MGERDYSFVEKGKVREIKGKVMKESNPCAF